MYEITFVNLFQEVIITIIYIFNCFVVATYIRKKENAPAMEIEPDTSG